MMSKDSQNMVNMVLRIKISRVFQHELSLERYLNLLDDLDITSTSQDSAHVNLSVKRIIRRSHRTLSARYGFQRLLTFPMIVLILSNESNPFSVLVGISYLAYKSSYPSSVGSIAARCRTFIVVARFSRASYDPFRLRILRTT